MSTIFSPALLQKAIAEARRAKRQPMAVLEELLGLDSSGFIDWLGQMSGYPVCRMQALHEMSPDFSQVSFADCQQRDVLPCRRRDDRLWVLVADPFDPAVRDWAWAHISERFSFGVVHLTDLRAYFTMHEESQRAMAQWATDDDAGEHSAEDIEVISLQEIAGTSSEVVRFVHATLYDALKIEASDIHLETTPAGLTIKYRIDGVLTQVGGAAGTRMAEQVISRLKVMSELDISERRVPQDGRFKVMIGGRPVDFRVSVMPSIFGEDAVLRILDKKRLMSQMAGLTLESLGFDNASLAMIRKMSREPYGMFLVTGPTGSGKTTTLYAAISEINDGRDKIITIEDPVEYQLPGILQIPVNEKKGLSFARGLRSILRHDPDKIMIGEIRDAETAQIAVQSALTGHLVFTTVHANNVFDVLGRFLHMGVDPYSFVSALNGILAQRLVRVNCVACSVEARPSAELLRDSGLTEADCHDFNFRAGRGCGQCRGTGFKGRKALAELLTLNDMLRELIVARRSIREIKEAASRSRTRLLRESALDLVRQGETTLQEINRVTFIS